MTRTPTFMELAGHLAQACDLLDDLVDDLRKAILRGDREALSTLQDRFERGHAEHAGTDGDWAVWTLPVLHMAAQEEVMDGAIYLAEYLRRTREARA